MAVNDKTTKPRRQKVRICDIDMSDDVKPRANWTASDIASQYRAAYEAGESLPPIVVFSDETMPERYWLADGWHRLDAQATYENDEGLLDFTEDPTEVEAEVHPGGKIAAMLFAAGANTAHGLRRTSDDAVVAAKVAIRALVLQDPEHRPTVEAIKATARVGTGTAQRAFEELAKETSALPPKDPRGGARTRESVPRGTNAAPVDRETPLPTEPTPLPLAVRETPPAAEPTMQRIVRRQRQVAPDPPLLSIVDFDTGEVVENLDPKAGQVDDETAGQHDRFVSSFERMQSAIREALVLPSEEAAESWQSAGGRGDLADELSTLAREIEAYAAAVSAAQPLRVRVVKQ